MSVAEQKVRDRSQGNSAIDTPFAWLTGVYDNLTLQTEVVADHIAVLGTLSVKAPILRGVIYVVKGVTDVAIDEEVKKRFGSSVHVVWMTWQDMAKHLAPITEGVLINTGDGAVATDGGIAVGKGGIIIRNKN